MILSERLISFFAKNLLEWHNEYNDRSLPWKQEQDPYKIWLSEIILQQTRAQQGMPYYLKITEHYPTIQKLAAADDFEVYKMWQGLGYYNRCKNMLATARHIATEYNGVFPKDYESILDLKGVGAYTAAAIASFAFNLPYAVVDGNVYRVLSRFLGIDTPIDTTEGKQLFAHLAQKLLAKETPAAYNQAIMDFGALVCTPKRTKCIACILSARCVAFQKDMVNILPIKSKKLQVKTRCFQYLVLQFQDEFYVQQRLEKDIWQNLFEFILVESEAKIEKTEKFLQIKPFVQQWEKSAFQNKQKLTHQLIISDFHILHLKEKPDFLPAKNWVELKKIKNIAFPRTIFSFFNGKKYF